jgi:hypothetical protein
MHASIEPDVAVWDRAITGLADDTHDDRATVADLMHSLDLSVLARW